MLKSTATGDLKQEIAFSIKQEFGLVGNYELIVK